MSKPQSEVVGPEHPISLVANAISDQAFTLAGGFGISRWDLCVALANACGQILADNERPPPDGVAMPKRTGKPMPRKHALERMDGLRETMQVAYDLRSVEGEG